MFHAIQTRWRLYWDYLDRSCTRLWYLQCFSTGSYWFTVIAKGNDKIVILWNIYTWFIVYTTILCWLIIQHLLVSRHRNSLSPRDVLMWQTSGSTLVQQCLGAWQHQGIAWTNVDFSLMCCFDIHLRDQLCCECPGYSTILFISFKIILLKLLS